tara:strand:- start:1079 stop:1312 length:234 start_codon:yes stop_codon:yes gene_type:complete
MVSTVEWATKEKELKQTSRLQINLQSWEEGDILHFYQDMVVLFQELQSDHISLTNKNRRIIENGYTSFDKIFNRTKS